MESYKAKVERLMAQIKGLPDQLKEAEKDNFNRIMEMHTEAERRRFAAMAMQAILSNEARFKQAVSEFPLTDGTHNKYFGVAQCAVAYTDALISELDKKKES